MDRLAYLGLGIMGQGMATTLLDAGYDLTVWNRTAAKCEPLVDAGATRAYTPAEATRGADAVFYSLANGDAVEAVVFGGGGLPLAHVRRHGRVDGRVGYAGGAPSKTSAAAMMQ